MRTSSANQTNKKAKCEIQKQTW